jgi:DNA processing protein
MDENLDQLKQWLALLHAPGLGGRGINALLQEVGAPGPLFSSDHATLKRLGLKGQTITHLRASEWEAVDNDLAWLEKPGNHILTLGDDRYPALLREIPDPPPVLFVHGDPALLHHPQLAMVGSRNPSPGGRDNALNFARHLAAAGLTVTSGLAIGIDGAAHQGALDGEGHTVAVTGTGLDRVYPASQRELAHRIADQGVLVSEFSPGTPPLAANFPRRNRIISGLSIGTLVVEAALKSGSLITARLALEQGREVFAIPGSIHNPLARGCHTLIRQGAKLVETASDIMEELAPLLGSLESTSETGADPSSPPDRNLDPEYLQLLESVGHDPTSVDSIIERSGLTADIVSSMLLLLELEGYVSSATGGRYCRTR